MYVATTERTENRNRSIITVGEFNISISVTEKEKKFINVTDFAELKDNLHSS